jgi:hypothetical protein
MVTTLLAAANVRIERIVSHGHASSCTSLGKDWSY